MLVYCVKMRYFYLVYRNVINLSFVFILVEVMLIVFKIKCIVMGVWKCYKVNIFYLKIKKVLKLILFKYWEIDIIWVYINIL